MKLTICYLSPYYYLYDEDKNELIEKSVDVKELEVIKKDLEK